MIKKSRKRIRELLKDGKAIDRAMKEATQEAVEIHRLLGHPIAVWKDGKVVWIPAKDIPPLRPKQTK